MGVFVGPLGRGAGSVGRGRAMLRDTFTSLPLDSGSFVRPGKRADLERVAKKAARVNCLRVTSTDADVFSVLDASVNGKEVLLPRRIEQKKTCFDLLFREEVLIEPGTTIWVRIKNVSPYVARFRGRLTLRGEDD